MTESNRNSLMLAGDVIKRSMTRNSHYSRASTQSWVLSNQQNPPPPPPDEPLPSPVRTSRPLPDNLPSPGRTPRPSPDPQLQAYHYQLHTNDADHIPATAEDEEEYMNIDPNLPGIETGYLTEGLGRGRPPITDSSTAADPNSGRERGFVGGFVSGLRRLPRVVLKYRSFGDKRKYFRQATYGSGGTLTNGTFTNGTDTVNTLPLYVSNPPTPVAGPSNTRYVEAFDMPVPHPPEAPTSPMLNPSLSQRHHPSFRVSPPEEAADHQHVTEPPVVPVQPSPPAVIPVRGSNTVTVYNLPEQEDYRAEEPALPLPALTPNRLSNSQSQNQTSPVASIPAEVHPQSPVLVRPPPTSDYRKMTLSSSPRSPGTMSTSLNSEPSFSSQLSPVRSFLVKLYRLPWIAQDRVTDDFRPSGRDARHGNISGVKKPMTSWYKGTPGAVLSVKNGSGEVDLLSSSSGSRRTSAGSSTPLSSPGLRVRHRSSDHHHHHRTHHQESRRRTHHSDNSSRNQARSRHRRDTVISTTDFQPQTQSHIIPSVYPYPYPFPIPYPTFSTSAPLPPPQRTESQSTPRGPRPHRTQTYPHGYVPYQPPQPPPAFFMASPAQSASSVNHSHPQTQVTSPMYIPMSLVPGALPQETTQLPQEMTQQAASPPSNMSPPNVTAGGT